MLHCVVYIGCVFLQITFNFGYITGWLTSRVVSMLDSGADCRRAGVQIAFATLLGKSLRQTVHTHRCRLLIACQNSISFHII